jgi:hypothetical protein
MSASVEVPSVSVALEHAMRRSGRVAFRANFISSLEVFGRARWESRDAFLASV